MCASLKEDVFASDIQLVVLDEAHKLRNVHNEKSVTANNVKAALTGNKKILLPATPIQNNLMDLYGWLQLLMRVYLVIRQHLDITISAILMSMKRT